MDPLTIAYVLSSLGSILGPAVFGGGQNAQIKKRQDEMMKLLTPENILRITNSLFQGFKGGPAGAAASRTAFATGTQTSNDLMSRLARAGLLHTGVGSAAATLGRSQTGSLMSGVDASAWQQALEMAGRLAGAGTGALGNLPIQGPGVGAQAFAGGLEGLNRIIGLLGKQQPQPAMGGGGIRRMPAATPGFSGPSWYWQPQQPGNTGAPRI